MSAKAAGRQAGLAQSLGLQNWAGCMSQAVDAHAHGHQREGAGWESNALNVLKHPEPNQWMLHFQDGNPDTLIEKGQHFKMNG